MAHNLTDIDTFTSAVSVPDGGDDRTAASVETPFQALANRTRNSKTRLDNLGVTAGITVSHAGGLVASTGDVRANQDFEYCDAAGAAVSKTRTVMITCSRAGNTPGWISAGAGLQAMQASALLEIPLAPPLQTGCRITLVRVAYLNASAPSSPPDFDVIRKVPAKGATPGIGVQNTEGHGAGTNSASPQIMTTGAISSAIVNLATEEWFVRVFGQQINDVIYWIELTYTEPGPRNF